VAVSNEGREKSRKEHVPRIRWMSKFVPLLPQERDTCERSHFGLSAITGLSRSLSLPPPPQSCILYFDQTRRNFLERCVHVWSLRDPGGAEHSRAYRRATGAGGKKKRKKKKKKKKKKPCGIQIWLKIQDPSCSTIGDRPVTHPSRSVGFFGERCGGLGVNCRSATEEFALLSVSENEGQRGRREGDGRR